uniref:Uncharacterized protein n=1 Tax=Fagus sylvatica TaxID=28930 RepID=A0A2N9EJP5_FAGSY
MNAPLSFIKSVKVSFSDRPDLKTAILVKQPFKLKRQTVSTRSFKLSLKINFSDGCGCQCTSVEFPVNFQVLADSIKHDKDVVVQKLRKTAIQDQCCGQISLVEKKNHVPPTKEVAVYAIATDFVEYYSFLASTGLSEDIPKKIYVGLISHFPDSAFGIDSTNPPSLISMPPSEVTTPEKNGVVVSPAGSVVVAV